MTLSLKGDSVLCLLVLCESNGKLSIACHSRIHTIRAMHVDNIMRFQNTGMDPKSQWINFKREILSKKKINYLFDCARSVTALNCSMWNPAP